MGVREGLVLVPVRVGLAGRVRRAVRVPMVLVVRMTVRVDHPLVTMLMLMPLGQVQPDADGHEHAGGDPRRSDRFPKDQDRQACAHEWGDEK